MNGCAVICSMSGEFSVTSISVKVQFSHPFVDPIFFEFAKIQSELGQNILAFDLDFLANLQNLPEEMKESTKLAKAKNEIKLRNIYCNPNSSVLIKSN